jgi:glycosyltransferase involved in cell wall biosynthesis
MDKRIRIGIDCRLAGRRHAGIGRYIQNLVIRLPKIAPQVDWVYFFADQQHGEEVLASLDETYRKKISIVFAPYRHYSLVEQMKMPQIFRRANLDLLHVPHFNVPLRWKGNTIVTIHDLLWHEYKGTEVTTLPQWQYWMKYGMYKQTVKHAVQTAKHIIVPAKTIQDTVLRYFPKVKSKITVTTEGIDDSFWSELKKAPPKKTNITSPANEKTFIYVGSLYPHKNVKLVIDALSQLPEYQLLIVGTRNVFQTQLSTYVQQKKLEHQVKFLGYVPDEELLPLFQRCTALVQPSFSEGFGLTGVEAMAARLPILASHIPIFKEIYQDAAEYFDPSSCESFITAVHALEKADRQNVIEKGYALAQKYSWDTMAQDTWNVYQKAMV